MYHVYVKIYDEDKIYYITPQTTTQLKKYTEEELNYVHRHSYFS